MADLDSSLFPASIDICIIGAGPAGATASMFLSKMGVRHLLLDKETFPRDKTCGDGLDVNTIRTLNHFDPQLVQKLLADTEHFTAVCGVRFIAPNGKRAEPMYRPVRGGSPEMMCITGKRFHFDNFLHQQLDPKTAIIRLGATVTNLERVENGIVVTIEKDGQTHAVFTRLVLGADGDHSVVLRKLDERKIDRKYYAAALRIYCKGVTDMHPQSALEVYFPKSFPMGYFWIFPLPNGEMNVGIVMQSSQISNRKINLRNEFERIIAEDPHIAPRFANVERLETPQGWGLPLAARNRKTVGDNYLLLGDAGSLINPLSGEGIGSAMVSGWVAAEFAATAVKTQQFDAVSMQNYQYESVYRLNNEINVFNRIININAKPWSSPFLNLIIGSGLTTLLFERTARQWMDTATNKPLEMRLTK